MSTWLMVHSDFIPKKEEEVMMTEAPKSESEIVWLEDIHKHEYVRVSSWMAHNRQKPPGKRTLAAMGHIVGYSVLHKHCQNNSGVPGYFFRRLFWLKRHDRSNEPGGVYKHGAPVEAVDPLTIHPGVSGELSDRAWEGAKL